MKNINEILDTKLNIMIDNLNDDSRSIKENGLFFAIKGLTVDGNDFALNAVKNGAVAVVSSKELKLDVPVIVVKDVQSAYNNALNKFYDNVTEKMKFVSATGTDGKTTVTEIVYQMLNSREKAGYIGTNGIKCGKFKMENEHTTPMPDTLFKAFHEFSKIGCKYVTMESSSERLATGKLEAVPFDVAIFTNLTRDHLDYHKTMENYAKAKAMSFSALRKGGLGVVNYDDEYKNYFIDECKEKLITYSISDSNADIYASNILVRYNRLEFDINGIYGHHHIISHISGKYNVYNIMCAIACLKHFGYDIKTIIRNIALIKPIEARQLLLKTEFGFNVMIDYGHTPNAIKNLYEYVRPITQNKIIIVYGAAGSRDQRRMIEVANFCTTNADHCVFTIEDARYDDPHELINLMVSEVKTDNYEMEIDRDKAIKKALLSANQGDMVLILGKGLEKYQITNGKLIARPNDLESCKRTLKVMSREKSNAA